MSILDKIEVEQVRIAIDEIDKNGVPRNRTYDRYYLLVKDQKYPVKYVISLANKYIDKNLTPLAPNVFSTYDAQKHLKKLGYEIIDGLSNQIDKNKGFKLLGLKLIENTLLGSIYYSFIDEEDKQDKIYTTVLIGPNGTGKSNLFRIVIELLRDLYNLSQGKGRTYIVDGQFNITYSFGGDIFSFTNIVDLDVAKQLPIEKSRQYSYLTRNGEVIDFTEILLPLNIVANSIMLTDKYPVYPDANVFPQYKYLGVRNTAQNASTRSYVRKTVDYIIAEKDSSAFRSGLKRITEFLGMDKSIEVYYKTINAPIFFKGNTTSDTFYNYFNALIEKYRGSNYPPQKLNNFLKLASEPKVIENLSNFCNDLFHRNRLEWVKRGSTVRKISYNITSEKSFQSLKEESNLLEQLRQIGLLYAPEIYLKREGSYSLQESSSGEYHFFSSMVALMATVKINSLIFLDEPEISLHPNWQMKYISFVRNLFGDINYNTSHIIVATHSHFLISDLDGRDSKIIGLKKGPDARLNSNIIEVVNLPRNMDTFGWSAEDVLYNVFDVVTVRNKYVADTIGNVLDRLSKGDKEKNNVLDKNTFELLIHLQTNLKEIDPLKQVVDSIFKNIN